jgi:hypothetical protein
VKKLFIAVAGLLLVLAAAGPLFAQSSGSKHFGCIEMRWQVPAGQPTVSIIFLKDAEPFASMVLGPQESFRQFSFSAESVFAEGRIRVKYDQETRKGLLRIDSLTYRCYSPSDQRFSGEIAEFDLPDSE